MDQKHGHKQLNDTETAYTPEKYRVTIDGNRENEDAQKENKMNKGSNKCDWYNVMYKVVKKEMGR